MLLSFHSAFHTLPSCPLLRPLTVFPASVCLPTAEATLPYPTQATKQADGVSQNSIHCKMSSKIVHLFRQVHICYRPNASKREQIILFLPNSQSLKLMFRSMQFSLINIKCQLFSFPQNKKQYSCIYFWNKLFDTKQCRLFPIREKLLHI